MKSDFYFKALELLGVLDRSIQLATDNSQKWKIKGITTSKQLTLIEFERKFKNWW